MSSIKKNVFYQAIYEILILILPFFTSPYISRLLGAEYLGIYSYTYSIAYYFQMFCMLGIKFYGNRSIAQNRNNQDQLDKVYSQILTLHMIVSLISTFCFVVYTLAFSKYKTYMILQGMMVLSSVFDVSWLFFGLEQFKTVVSRNTIIKILSVILIFTFVKKIDDFWIYIAIMSGTQLVSSLFLFLMSRKYVHFSCPKYTDIIPHIKPLFVLFIPILALSIFKYMDKIMLGMLGNKIELGYYENAEKVLNIPLSVVFSFGSVMLPRISNLIATDSGQLDRYMRLSIKYMVGLSIAMSFGMAGVAHVFAPVFWGELFTRSGIIIALLAISIPFSTLASIIRNQDLIPNGRDAYYSYSIIAGALINLIINYLLIPKYQAIGVTIGTIVAEITVCVAEVILVSNRNAYIDYLKSSLIFLVPSLIMFILVRMIGNYLGLHVYTLIVQVLSGVLVFGIITAILMVVFKDADLMRVLTRFRK